MNIELYDLEKDPQEMLNIAADNQIIVDRARRIMAEEHTEAALPRFRMAALGDKVETNE